LGHGAVARAFFDDLPMGGGGVAALDRFTQTMVGLGGGLSAPASLLLALVAEQSGRTLDAEARLHRAVLEDPEYGAALEELAWYVADRGEAAHAASLLRRSGATSADSQLRFLEDMEAQAPRAARNDPCPCGSGRKFKACCLHSPKIDTGKRCTWLVNKLVAYALRPAHRERVAELMAHASEARAGSEDQVLPVLVDVTLFEGGLIEDFLEERGMLLPPEELVLCRSWVGTPLRLWELVEVDPGRGMTLRDTRTGDQCVVSEHLGSATARAGDYLLARVVLAGDSHFLIGVPLQPQLHQRPSLMALLDSEPDECDIATWLGGAFSAPHVTNREGHDLVMCRARLMPQRSPWSEVEARLDKSFERHEDGTWIDTTEVEGGDNVIQGFLRRTDEGLLYETNSEERLDA
ncbi:MAG: SEC-C metal-binding domain-containing protein, partial [Acidimicrobiales bacterium]